MAISKVVKVIPPIPYTDRFDGVCLAFNNEVEDRNCYIVSRCETAKGIKYKLVPVFSKYTKFNSEKYYTKDEVLDMFLVISCTKPGDVQRMLMCFFKEEDYEEVDKNSAKQILFR